MAGWPPHRTRRSALRRALPIAAGAAVCYAAAYAAFSSWGQYVTPPDRPASAARWAPGEFYDFSSGRWRRSHTIFFAPLLWLDQRFWHTSAGGPPRRARMATNDQEVTESLSFTRQMEGDRPATPSQFVIFV